MAKTNNLTEGNISNVLIELALPIMGTSFVQMAYNMIDMIWIGRVGSNAMAAVGTAGFFMWLGMAFILIPKISAEVGVAQSIGREDEDSVKNYIRHTLQLIVFLAVIYGSFLILFRKNLIGFFNLGDTEVTSMAISYLVIIASGIIFGFINPVFTAILNGYGDSRTPFYINTVGLVLNMIVDPLLIFGVGRIPALGVQGAALATISAQFIVTLIFIITIRIKMPLFTRVKFIKWPNLDTLNRIFELGLPASIQSGMFTIFAIILARIIAKWGPVPIAVQKVGSQIESISWMTAGGFSTALSAFVGQNYGAKKWNRIYKGYISSMKIVGVIGIFATCLLIFGARPLFALFLPDKEALKYGVVYLEILGVSQFFMCIEIATGGAFNGLGKTLPPSIVGIIFNALRVPAALLLSSEALLGLNGVWWSISLSSVLKGIILTTWFIIVLRKNRYLISMDSE